MPLLSSADIGVHMVPRVSMMDAQYVPGIPNTTPDWNNLVTRAMGLERGQVDSTPGEVREPRRETLARVDPLDVRGNRGMNVAALQPDAGIEIERVRIRVFVRVYQMRPRKWNSRIYHQRRQTIAMRVQRGARAVDDPHPVTLPLGQILERRSSLAHGKNQRCSRTRTIRFRERHEVDGKLPFPQPVRDLVEEQHVVRLVPAGRILLLAVQSKKAFHIRAVRRNVSAASMSAGRSTSTDREIGMPARG